MRLSAACSVMIAAAMTLVGCVPSVPFATNAYARNVGGTMEIVICDDVTFTSTSMTRGMPAELHDTDGLTSEVVWTVRAGEPLDLQALVMRLGLDIDSSPLRAGELLSITGTFTGITPSGRAYPATLLASFSAPFDGEVSGADSNWLRSDRTVNPPTCLN